MTRYTFVFVGLHLLTVLLLTLLVGGLPWSPGSGLGMLLVAFDSYAVALIFAKQRRRRFSDRERWQLIWKCSIYLTVFEGVTIWCFATFGHRALTRSDLVFGFAVGVALDLLALWAGYTRWAGTMFDKRFPTPEMLDASGNLKAESKGARSTKQALLWVVGVLAALALISHFWPAAAHRTH